MADELVNNVIQCCYDTDYDYHINNNSNHNDSYANDNNNERHNNYDDNNNCSIVSSSNVTAVSSQIQPPDYHSLIQESKQNIEQVNEDGAARNKRHRDNQQESESSNSSKKIKSDCTEERLKAIEEQINQLSQRINPSNNHRNNNNNVNNTRSKYHCDVCNRNGHTKDRCWNNPASTSYRATNKKNEN